MEIKISPHSRDRSKKVKGVIIHSIGEYIKDHGYCIDFLDKIKLSAHYFISPGGKVIQCVNPSQVAFHAGASSWKGEKNLNETYIGIELMIPGEHDFSSFLKAIKSPLNFSNAQYKKCAQLCNSLCKEFDISPEYILRHSDVSGPSVRKDPKEDPGEGFSMKVLKDLMIVKKFIAENK